MKAMRLAGRPMYLSIACWIVLLATLPAVVVAQRADTPSALRRLEIAPRAVTLDGREARQRLLVTGYRRDGSVVDLTDTARFETTDAKVMRVDESGIAHPVSDGKATLTARVNGRTATVTVTARNIRKPFMWSFENHVESVLSKQGCNMGICHGAASGKGGFRLSLRAYAPDLDYTRLRYEGRGRRLALASPKDSLFLKKPSLALAHYGGLRLRSDSLEYRVVSEWIRAGAPGPQPHTPQITGLEVFPRERALLPGAKQRLLVTARFSDGHTEDVTQWAKYSSNEESLATVDDTGLTTMRGLGETAISVWYLGRVTFARLSVPFPETALRAVLTSSKRPVLPRNNFIDDRVDAKLAKLRLWPSELCTDAEFVRRVTLDTIGILPTPAETRAFLADRAPDKRARLIDALLERPEFVDRWTYAWCDLLRVNRETLGGKGMWSFYFWIRQSVKDNKPWSQFAREIVTAQGVAGKDGPVNFYRMGNRPEEFAETVSQAFLGIRVQCAHCHNHPFEKWTQSDYYRMTNFFARIGRKGKDEDETLFAADSGDVNHPKLGRPLPPAAFDGPALALDAPGDRRRFLADWMTAPDNPYFARALVNRVWKRYMGRGLVEPVDEMRLTNPASNEPLLAALTQDFVKHDFDVKHLMQTIMLSRSYQLSARPNATNRADDRFYSRYLPRRLPAETLLDAICQVTGQPEKFDGAPLGTRAAALPDTRIASAFLDAFGRPPRQVTCECERNAEPSVAQALHLLNAQTLNAKIAAKGGLLDRLLASSQSDREILAELYLICLCRPPSPSEIAVFQRAMTEGEGAGERKKEQGESPTTQLPNYPITQLPNTQHPTPSALRGQVFADLLWALLSGPEFQFNH